MARLLSQSGTVKYVRIMDSQQKRGRGGLLFSHRLVSDHNMAQPDVNCLVKVFFLAHGYFFFFARKK